MKEVLNAVFIFSLNNTVTNPNTEMFYILQEIFDFCGEV